MNLHYIQFAVKRCDPDVGVPELGEGAKRITNFVLKLMVILQEYTHSQENQKNNHLARAALLGFAMANAINYQPMPELDDDDPMLALVDAAGLSSSAALSLESLSGSDYLNAIHLAIESLVQLIEYPGVWPTFVKMTGINSATYSTSTGKCA
jgi:hypothetical protein